MDGKCSSRKIHKEEDIVMLLPTSSTPSRRRRRLLTPCWFISLIFLEGVLSARLIFTKLTSLPPVQSCLLYVYDSIQHSPQNSKKKIKNSCAGAITRREISCVRSLVLYESIFFSLSNFSSHPCKQRRKKKKKDY